MELRRLYPTERRDEYVAAAQQVIDDGRRTYSKWYSALQGWYEIYRGYWKGTSDPQWNNVHIPALFSLIQAFVARLHSVAFGESPYVSFIPTGPEDTTKARKNERLITEEFQLSNIQVKGLRYLLSASMYGVGIAHVGWRRQYGPTWRREGAVNSRALRIRGRRASSTILKYDFPDFENVDGTDFVPAVGEIDVEKMRGCARRYYMTFDEIVAGAHEGPQGEPPIYDRDEVLRMGSSKPCSSVSSDATERKSMASGGMDEKTWGQIQAGAAEIYDVYLTVPQELGLWWDPESGQWDTEEFPGAEYTTELLVTLADRVHCLRAIPNPFWLQEKPFLVHRPFEDPHYFHAPGMIEIGLKAQVATNRLVNTQLDAYDMWANPPWMADISRVDPRQIKNGAGRIIPVDGPIGDDVLKQLEPNLQGIRDIFPQTAYLWRIMQQATGISEDLGFGVQTSKRQTRAEFLGREGAMGVRIGLSAALMEAQFIEPLARWYFELNRQYLDFGTAIDLIGASAVWDPVLGTYIPDEPVAITDSDLAADFDIRAVGATKTLGKAARQQNMLAFLQVLPALLPFMPTFNMWAFGRELMPLFDMPNVDEMLGTAEQAKLAMIINLMQKGGAGGAGTDGTGAAGKAGGPPEQPIMGALGPGIGGLTGESDE